MTTWRYEISLLVLKNIQHSKRNFVSPRGHVISSIYFIDRSVLLENTPFFKDLFYKKTFFTPFFKIHTKLNIRDQSGVFSISSQVRILMTSFPALSRLFVPTVGEKW